MATTDATGDPDLVTGATVWLAAAREVWVAATRELLRAVDLPERG